MNKENNKGIFITTSESSTPFVVPPHCAQTDVLPVILSAAERSRNMQRHSVKTSNKSLSGNFNWGTGLVIVITLFICTTLGVVAYLVSLDYYVVADNYYEQAENYQQHIDRLEQTDTLDEPVEIELAGDKQTIALRFPSTITDKNVSGKIELYRPNNSSLDQRLDLVPDDENMQHIDTGNLARGKWVIKVSWTSNNKNYYKQKSIFL